MTTKYRAFTPNGERIIGTLEEVQGCAYAEFYTLEANGQFYPEYEGETKFYWDSQVSVVRGDQRVFLDQNGSDWPESQVTFAPVESEPPQADTTWEDNGIQFPRLIAELEAAAAFTPEVLDALASSMDLEPSEVHELIERAVSSWDHIVRNTFAPTSEGKTNV